MLGIISTYMTVWVNEACRLATR